VTVLWTLSVVATVLAETLGLGVLFVLAFFPAGDPIPTLRLLPGLMLFTAFLTGLMSILLLPLVYRFRRLPPPLSLVVFSLIAAALPAFVAGILALRVA
jgi:hypothetical protein